MKRSDITIFILSLISVLLSSSSVSFAQNLQVKGVVQDAITTQVLPGTEVRLLDTEEAAIRSTTTDEHGQYLFEDLETGYYVLIFLREQYETLRVTEVRPRGATDSGLIVRLVKWVTVADTIMVTASRRPEPEDRTPASTSIIQQIEIREQPHVTPVDLARDVTGMDFASKGLMQHTYSVRGVRGVTSASMLVLADDRYTAMPVLNYNISYSMSQTSDDIDHIEIVRGPGAAIYGPNTAQGVLHVITRSPFESEGTSLSLVGGEREVMQGTVRHARILGKAFAFKISGQFYAGRDWVYNDPVEEDNREDEIAGGADPDTLKVGNRDFDIKHARGDLRFDWRAGDNTTFVLNSGVAQTGNAIDLISTTGAMQIQDWWNAFVQGRFKHKRFKANLLYNFGDTRNTFFLRTGAPVTDDSRIIAGQLQYSSVFMNLVDVLYGVDIRVSEPSTNGTVHGRYENNDTMSEFGGYFTSTTGILGSLDLVAALRVDYHDRINDTAISPRAGLVYEPYAGHALRVTYNRAYDSPAARDLFLDIKLGEILPGMMDLRLVSVPKGGFNFSRGCGDNYTMRSPFHPDGAKALMCADATLMWPVLVQQIPSLASVPPPNSSQVSTDLRSFNLQGGYSR